MEITYFGNIGTYDNPSTHNNTVLCWQQTAFTCPGSGDKIVKALEGYFEVDDAGSHTARLAIYTAAGALVASSVDIIVTSWSFAWQGVTNTGLTPVGGSLGDAVTLTGGNDYFIALQCDHLSLVTGELASGALERYASLAWGSFPSTLPSPTTTSEIKMLRCGVEVTGSVCWGHETGVEEANARRFSGNWSGTGEVE